MFEERQVPAGSAADLFVEERRDVICRSQLDNGRTLSTARSRSWTVCLANCWFRPQRSDGCIELVVPDGGEEVAEIVES